MPVSVPPVAGEREALLGYLSQQRCVLRVAAYGLSDEQVRATPTVSALSIGGLLKHLAAVERHWVSEVLHRNDPPRSVHSDVEDYNAGFRLSGGETLASLRPAVVELAWERKFASRIKD